jgi:hypothetical protein
MTHQERPRSRRALRAELRHIDMGTERLRNLAALAVTILPAESFARVGALLFAGVQQSGISHLLGARDIFRLLGCRVYL